MFKALLIGDVHHLPAESEDCEALIDYIQAIAEENKIDQIIFMGDIFHWHNVIRLESLYFWRKVFERLNKFGITSLVGNHDRVENGDPLVHSLIGFKELIRVIETPTVDSGILFLPYYHDKQKFINDSLAVSNITHSLICHSSFEGSKFNDGYFDPDGINPIFIKQKNIIAGHVHLPSQFDKVHHIGAPRWRIISDANVERNIWIFEFDSQGDVVKRTPFPTSVVCRKIVHFIDEELNPFNLNLFNNKDDFRVDIKGNTAYIEKRTKELKLALPSVKIRPIKTNNEFIKIRESEGIKTAYDKYITNYKPKYGTSLEKLHNLSYSRLGFDQ